MRYYLSVGIALLLGLHGMTSYAVNPVATINLGPAWYQGGKTQTIAVASDFSDTYQADQKNRTTFNGGIFAGVQGNLAPLLIGQLGILYENYASAKLTGNVWELNLPIFNNFTYQYRIKHQLLAIQGNVLLPRNETGYRPYIKGALGIGYNKAYHFLLQEKLYAAVPPPAFRTQAIQSFSYLVGAGIQKPLSAHWSVGAGYEFANWGKSQLAPAVGQASQIGLTTHSLNTHQLQFNLSYVL